MVQYKSPLVISLKSLIFCGMVSCAIGCRHLNHYGSTESIDVTPKFPAVDTYESTREPHQESSESYPVHSPLEPVPPLPEPGHTAPKDPIVPPSPAEVKEPKKDAEPQAGPEENVSSKPAKITGETVNETSRRTALLGVGTSEKGSSGKLPPLRPGRHAAVLAPSSFSPDPTANYRAGARSQVIYKDSGLSSPPIRRYDEIFSNRNLPDPVAKGETFRVSHQSQTGDAGLPVDYTGPVITPRSTPTEKSGYVIESWPYRSPQRQAVAPTGSIFSHDQLSSKVAHEEIQIPESKNAEQLPLPPLADSVSVPILNPPN